MWKRCRSTAKRYPGDNRLIVPKSPYRRHCLAPRCRLIASWGRSRSQGLGCSPIKAVRELGLERRETVNIALSVNSAKCWKLRKHPAVPPLSHPSASVRTTAEVTIRQVVIRVITPDNQQERLDDYLAGYVDGEGSFHVAIQRNPSTRFGWQLVPEFHVSQNPERASILELLRARLGCGRIRPNARAGGRDRSLVYVVRNRNDLLTKVIPFFRATPSSARSASSSRPSP